MAEILTTSELKTILAQHGENRKGVYRAFVSSYPTDTISDLNGRPARLTWTQRAIRQISDLLSVRKPSFFAGHDGARPLGEVVASGIKEIGQRVINFVVGYFPDPKLVEQFTSISIEAITNPENGIVDQVQDVDRIAFVPAGERPAFAGAGELARVTNTDASRVLNYTADQQIMNNYDVSPPVPKVKIMNLSEVKHFIAENQWSPDQLFPAERLVSTDLVKSEIEKRLEERVAPITQQLSEYKQKAHSVEFRSAVDSLLSGEQDETIKKLAEKRLASAQFDPDQIPQSAKQFVGNLSKELEDLKEILGPVKPAPKAGVKIAQPARDGAKPANPFLAKRAI